MNRAHETLLSAVVAGGLCAGCVAASGQQQGSANPSRSFAPGACGHADQAYIRTANATGGVPLFLQRSEAGKAMQLMRESTRENVSTVLWASARLDGTTQKFQIPVDWTTERITFTFSVDTKGTRLVLREPHGQAVGEGSASTEDTELNCDRLITVEKPQPGDWHAEVSGSGTYWLEAQAQSEIHIIRAEFVKPGGRIGHEGLYKIQGQPLVGEPAMLQASLSATKAETTEFALVSERGDILKQLHLKITDPDNTDRDRRFLEFTGKVVLPDVPFRLAVTGQDTNGTRYQRFYEPLFHAESVAVIPKLDFDELAPGSESEAEFELRNLGPARSFKVIVTDAHSFAKFGETRQIDVDAQGTAPFKVKLTVPPDAARGTDDELVVVASSTSGPAATNSAIVRLTVAGSLRPQQPH